jgi:hypothetical protein
MKKESTKNLFDSKDKSNEKQTKKETNNDNKEATAKQVQVSLFSLLYAIGIIFHVVIQTSHFYVCSREVNISQRRTLARKM